MLRRHVPPARAAPSPRSGRKEGGGRGGREGAPPPLRLRPRVKPRRHLVCVRVGRGEGGRPRTLARRQGAAPRQESKSNAVYLRGL